MKRPGIRCLFNFVWGLLILIGVTIGEFSPYFAFFGAMCWFSTGYDLFAWTHEGEAKYR